MILRFPGSRTFSHGLDPNRTFGPAYEIVWPFRDISTADAQFDRPGAPSGGCAGRAVEAGHAKAERQNARDRRISSGSRSQPVVPAMAGTRIRVPLGQQIGVTDGRGAVVQILGKFVVIACHRAERLTKGIIEGRFGELSYFLCPRATVGSCVHASQTVSLAARFRVEVTLLWKNATRTVLARHPGSFASARVCPSDKNLVTALFTRVLYVAPSRCNARWRK